MDRESGAEDTYLGRRVLLETWSCHSCVLTALFVTADKELLVYIFVQLGWLFTSKDHLGNFT